MHPAIFYMGCLASTYMVWFRFCISDLNVRDPSTAADRAMLAAGYNCVRSVVIERNEDNSWPRRQL